MSDQNNTSLKNKVGLFFILLSQIAPVFSLIIPFFGFPEKIEYTLITLTFIGGKHVILILGIALAGKKGLLLVRHKALSFLGIPEEKHAATKLQYNLALFIILCWFFIIILADFFPRINETAFVKTYHFWIVLGSDILFIIAVFLIGGNQMIYKIGRLFTWQPWELASKEKKKE